MERRAAFVLLGMLYLAAGTLVTVQAGEYLSPFAAAGAPASSRAADEPRDGTLLSFDSRRVIDRSALIPSPDSRPFDGKTSLWSAVSAAAVDNGDTAVQPTLIDTRVRNVTPGGKRRLSRLRDREELLANSLGRTAVAETPWRPPFLALYRVHLRFR